jgi:uncharacterized protein YfbU (UPF0304 family)
MLKKQLSKQHSKAYKEAITKSRIKRTGFFKTWENIYFSPVSLSQYLKAVGVKGKASTVNNTLVYVHDNQTHLDNVRYAKKEKYAFIKNRQLSLFGYCATSQSALVDKLDISKSTLIRTLKELDSKGIIFKQKVHKLNYMSIVDTGTRLLMLHAGYLNIILDMFNASNHKEIDEILKSEYKMLISLIELYATQKNTTTRKACVTILDTLNMYLEQIDMYQFGTLDVHALRSVDIKRAVCEYLQLDI